MRVSHLDLPGFSLVRIRSPFQAVAGSALMIEQYFWKFFKWRD